AWAEACLAVGGESGSEEEMDWLLEVLDWPTEWSALHGIAEIRTPVLKIIPRTDATPHKYVVRWQGRNYPAEGAHGLGFPYRLSRPPLLTLSPGFQRGLEHSSSSRGEWESGGVGGGERGGVQGFGCSGVGGSPHPRPHPTGPSP